MVRTGSGGGKSGPRVPEIDRVRTASPRTVTRPSKRPAALILSIAVVTMLAVSVVALMVPGDTVGSEFQVNSYTSDDQISPSVALNTSGECVVVWSSYRQDWGGYCVFVQVLDSTGQKVGSPFTVRNSSADDQINPDVAMNGGGYYSVVYQTTRDYQPGDGTYNNGIRQRYFSLWNQTVPVTPIVYGDSPDEYDPEVALSSEVSPLLTPGATVWTEADSDGSGEGIFGMLPWRSNESSLNTYTIGNQHSPSVAMDSDGDSIVVWCSDGQDGDSGGVFGQRFLADGNASGPEFSVNTYVPGSQTQPSVASDSSGNFVVVWSSNNQDGSDWGVYGQRFSWDGMKRGLEFRVNTYTSGTQYQPSVAMSSTGEFVVVWTSVGQDLSGSAVIGQRYYSDGTALGSEFRVNSYEADDQSLPCVSMNCIGDFAVVWQSQGQDGDGWGIYGQLYNRAPIPEFPSLVIPIAFTVAVLLALRKKRSP